MSEVAELMKRCQRGVGGRNALDEAHDIMAECYGTLGRLEAERDHLKACQENAQLHITGLVAERNAAIRQRDKLAGLLRDVESAYTTAIHWEDMQTAMAQIKTALSELTP